MAKKQTSLEDITIQNKNKEIINQTADPVQVRINTLVDEIRHHRYLYYNKTPEISDAAFDSLEKELQGLSPNHPVLSIIIDNSIDIIKISMKNSFVSFS